MIHKRRQSVKILFIHQNMPGQFVHLAPALAQAGHEVVFLTKRQDAKLPGVRKAIYEEPRGAGEETHPYLKLQEASVRYGQAVVRAITALGREGFRPDLVIGHSGWGEMLFVRDVLPRARILNYCEFYYRGRGSDVGFDPEDGAGLNDVCRARIRAGHLLTSLEACDHGLAPTQWQRSVHPEPFHDRISVVFDGIDTAVAHPDGPAEAVLPDGFHIRRGDELLTYVARNLEPYRGFRPFMRALPAVLRARPDAHVVIVGADGVSYGRKPAAHANWRESMVAELGDKVDWSRVHFTGKLPYADYLAVLRASRAHVYLTYPFVLSWSCLEAMACGALVIASDTAPVQEVIVHGYNGLLVDFFDGEALAGQIADVLAAPEDFAGLRARAIATVRDDYALSKCLPAQQRLIASIMA